jgi:hypothetical protein
MLTKKCSQHFQKNSDGKIFTAVQKIINKKNKKVKVRGIWGLDLLSGLFLTLNLLSGLFWSLLFYIVHMLISPRRPVCPERTHHGPTVVIKPMIIDRNEDSSSSPESIESSCPWRRRRRRQC